MPTERVLTYRIAGSISVLAKMEKGESVPYTFANRTQAEKRTAALVVAGVNASVFQRPISRPFYVRIDPDANGDFPWESPVEAFERGVSEGMADHAAALKAKNE